MTAEAGRLSHAYLVVSTSETERDAVAARLARTMVCEGAGERPCGQCRHCRKALAGIHPDIVTVERERDEKGVYKREFQVGRMREMRTDAWVRPNEASRKVYVLRDAQTLNQSAQNAILKLLEEPPGNACFILCADNAAALLPTVRSRCVTITGGDAGQTDADEATAERAETYLRLAATGDLPGLLKTLALWEKLDTESVRALVRQVCLHLTEMLCLRAPDLGFGRAGLAALLALMGRAEDYLRANVSPKHVLGLLSARTVTREVKEQK